MRLSNSPGWRLAELPLAAGARRSVSGMQDPFAALLAGTDRLEIVSASQLNGVARQRGRRGAPSAVAVVEADTAPDEFHVLMVRHASGAITFHLPSESRAAVRGTAKKTIRFSVPLSTASALETPGEVRRGIITKAIRAFLFKITGAIADLTMPALGGAWEAARWKIAGRAEGWKRATAADLSSKSLPVLTDFSAVSSDPSKPNLLFIHGTFSNALAAFHDLAVARGSDGKAFFENVADVYGGRIFAFDHFTVSRSLEENISMMLRTLPTKGGVFDVITHSRGGLVLRRILELPLPDGTPSDRFVLRRAVLVASPNGGTPLASPRRMDHFVTWIANVMDMFPENPFTEGVSFVSEALSWLVHRVADGLPGLQAMDSSGDEIRALQQQGGSLGSSYSALVSNFEPDSGLLQRMADAGVDVFFGSANDLVVPTEGGWRVDPGPASIIPGERIGCYGSGGNVSQPQGNPVSHVSFFSRKETVDFLVNALKEQVQPLNPIDPLKDLPFLLRRRALALPETQAPAAVQAPSPVAAPIKGRIPDAARPSALFTDEVFYISILDVAGHGSPREPSVLPEWAVLMATFRNARSVINIRLRDGNTGAQIQQIIAKHNAIHDYVNGKPGVNMPQGNDLVELGRLLFASLFPADVCRLYDVARAEQINRRINLIFTSQIPQLAELPWEFVYDPARENFLAASEVNFIRNVQTGIPGDRLIERGGLLRILVVVAQPLGLPHLSVEQEKEVILSGFRKLIEAGLASVEVLSDATPSLLHQALEANEYDVLHFIGHGEYDDSPGVNVGCLVFEDDRGGVQKVDSDVLQQIICRRNIRLVFLNACETGEGGQTDFNRGVAPALVQAGVPAVIGNQYSVLDVSATAFARHLYWALAQGQTIGDAAREARVAVNYLISGEAIDWAVPVVFARDPAERLCTKKVISEIQREKTAEQQRTRRRSARDRSRVALWDVQRIIPDLDKIADSLTQAQDVFAIEAVSIPAPMGTWRREAKEGGVAFIDADKVAERLCSKPNELGVKRLIAFTNLPMKGSNVSWLYAWDDDGRKISLFSTSELLDELDPPKLSIERMLANAVAGFLSDLPAHEKGPKNCPNFYNDQRDIQWIAGPLNFCAACTKKLDRNIRSALESLLRVYP